MRKVRLIIISIYIIVIALITILTVVFIARVFLEGSDLYFKEVTKEEIKTPSSLEINNMIKILKDFKII